jgi:hypothetical protein
MAINYEVYAGAFDQRENFGQALHVATNFAASSIIVVQ